MAKAMGTISFKPPEGEEETEREKERKGRGKKKESADRDSKNPEDAVCPTPKRLPV